VPVEGEVVGIIVAVVAVVVEGTGQQQLAAVNREEEAAEAEEAIVEVDVEVDVVVEEEADVGQDVVAVQHRFCVRHNLCQVSCFFLSEKQLVLRLCFSFIADVSVRTHA
jgi:hypothetical protein